MHIEKRKLNGKVKYYLAHSFREGEKVHKISKYLGTNLSQSRLKERMKIAEGLIQKEIDTYRIIHDPLSAGLSDKEIAWVRRLESKIPLKVRHLSKEQWAVFSKAFTYNTNAIEGSKLTSQEVNDLIGDNRWPERTKEDIAEAYGVDEAIRFIRETGEHLSVGLIKKIHQIVFRNSKKFAGQVRKAGEEVVVMDNHGRVIHEGAPQPRVLGLLNDLISWYEKNKKRYPGLVLAAVVHNQFENIHPFRDGNGRVGRILLNNILLKHGLPPVNIEFKNRVEYYLSLQAYEKSHDVLPTLTLFMKEYKGLKEVLKDTMGDYRKRKM